MGQLVRFPRRRRYLAGTVGQLRGFAVGFVVTFAWLLLGGVRWRRF